VIEAADNVDVSHVRGEMLASLDELKTKGPASKRDASFWGQIGQGAIAAAASRPQLPARWSSEFLVWSAAPSPPARCIYGRRRIDPAVIPGERACARPGIQYAAVY